MLSMDRNRNAAYTAFPFVDALRESQKEVRVELVFVYLSSVFSFRLHIVCGVFLVLNWVFLFKAFEEMSITVAITLYNLAPIFVLIIGSLFLKEKMTLTSLAMVTCFLGSVFIVGIKTSLRSQISLVRVLAGPFFLQLLCNDDANWQKKLGAIK